MDLDPLARVASLERQVARLTAELDELRTRVDRGADPGTSALRWAPPTSTSEPAEPAWPSPRAGPQPSVRSETTPSGPPSTRPDLVVDSETLLKWGGVGLVVLAVGFVVSTAITRDWIGPELQLLGALMIGFGLIGAGVRLRPTRPRWTHALCSGGVLALFTTVASDLFVEQANTDIAFGSTVVIGAGGWVLARTIRSEWVATATLAGGTIGWAVIAPSDPPVIATSVWFTVLIAALIALALQRQWFAVRLASHLVGMLALLALAGEANSTADRVVLGVSTALLVASLCWVPSIGDLSSIWQQLELQLAALATPWAFTVTVVAVLESESDVVIGWTALTFAAGAAAVAVALRDRIRPAHFVSLAIGASITSSIGVAVLMSTTATFIALAVQGAGLVTLGRALDRNVRVLVNAAVLVAISTVFVVATMIEAWSEDAPFADDIGHLLIIVAIAFAGWQSGEHLIRRFTALSTLGLTLIWLGSVLVHLPQGQAIVSISWAVIGTAIFVGGAVRRDREMGATGLAVIGLTVGKLLTVDLREVDTLWRAGLFFLVGVGLMRLGFMLPRLVEADDTVDDDAAENAADDAADDVVEG